MLSSLSAIAVAPAADSAGLRSAWDSFYSAVNGAFPNLFKWMAIIGVCLVVFGVAKYALDKRRGGANTQHLIWSVAAGGLLASPALLFPIALTVADSVINAFVSIFGGK